MPRKKDEVERMLPRNYVMEYLKERYPRKKITAEMFVGASGMEPEFWEAECISNAPEELRDDIQRLADNAREEKVAATKARCITRSMS
jgi:hypothetical protein